MTKVWLRGGGKGAQLMLTQDYRRGDVWGTSAIYPIHSTPGMASFVNGLLRLSHSFRSCFLQSQTIGPFSSGAEPDFGWQKHVNISDRIFFSAIAGDVGIVLPGDAHAKKQILSHSPTLLSK